jgi:8-amino-7-oxononanoate synthase
MEGDQAPLDALIEIADRHEAFLIVDEAHATGVFGPDGRGLAAHLDGRENVIAVRTCGKALGCEGALVLAPTVVRDVLVNRARPFIFATAPSPLVAAAVRESLRILQDEPERRAALHRRSAEAAERLARHDVIATGTQILPLILKEDARTMRVASALQAKGLDVRGVRPPTVPVGTSRLRISVTLNVETADLDALAEALDEALVSPPAA